MRRLIIEKLISIADNHICTCSEYTQIESTGGGGRAIKKERRREVDEYRWCNANANATQSYQISGFIWISASALQAPETKIHSHSTLWSSFIFSYIQIASIGTHTKKSRCDLEIIYRCCCCGSLSLETRNESGKSFSILFLLKIWWVFFYSACQRYRF